MYSFLSVDQNWRYQKEGRVSVFQLCLMSHLRIRYEQICRIEDKWTVDVPDWCIIGSITGHQSGGEKKLSWIIQNSSKQDSGKLRTASGRTPEYDITHS